MKNLFRFYHRQRRLGGHSLHRNAVLKSDAGQNADDIFISAQTPAVPISLDRGPDDSRRRFNKQTFAAGQFRLRLVGNLVGDLKRPAIGFA